MTKDQPKTPWTDKQVEFYDQTFRGLDWREQKLEGKEFHDCVFEGMQFNSAHLLRCLFNNCVFRSCDLSNVVVKNSTMREPLFEDAKLLGIDWTVLTALRLPVFRQTVLSFGNFSGLDLRKAVLAKCIAREIELSHTNLSGADCRATDFLGARFFHTNLEKADLRGATNYAIRAAENPLTKAKFSLPEATLLLSGLDIILEE